MNESTSKRVFNFSAGPCTLPITVLEEAQQEFVEYQDSGMSFIEMSHRGKHFMAVHEEAKSLAFKVFQCPDEFEVMFLQGGATLQFAMVPMNILVGGQRAAYINSGAWGKGAITDGKHYGDIYTAWDGADCQYSRMPGSDEITLEANTRYLHITSNETIGGVRFAEWPEVNVPMIGVMSSDYMSRPIPWERFDLVYGGAQKNLGPAGLAVVFIRKSILPQLNTNMARYLQYAVHCDKDSMFNTPPVFAVYMLGKVLRWMDESGGVDAMRQNAEVKSSILYSAIDNSDGYFRCPVDLACRSHMNVVFRLPTEELEGKFLAEATKVELLNLKGHRSVGGIRASIYNAMPESGVRALANLMSEFQTANPV